MSIKNLGKKKSHGKHAAQTADSRAPKHEQAPDAEEASVVDNRPTHAVSDAAENQEQAPKDPKAAPKESADQTAVMEGVSADTMSADQTVAFNGVVDGSQAYGDMRNDEFRGGDGAYEGGQPPQFAGAQFGVDAAAVMGGHKRKHGKVLAVILGVIVALLLIAYLAGAIYFMGRFFPNTYAGNHNFSLQPVEEVKQQLDDTISNYELTVSGQGFRLELTAQQTGLSIDTEAVVNNMHADASPWAWPVEIFRNHDESGKLAASYNEGGLDEVVRAAVDEFNVNKAAPVNASIGFNETTGVFEVTPEQPGDALNVDAVISAVDDALIALEDEVELTREDLQQPTVFSTEPALQTAADQANAMITANLTLTLAGDVAAEVNAAQISQWITLGENFSVTFNQEALTAWVDQVTANCNTVGTQRTYTRPDGKVITVSGGVYGWEVDRDALLAQVQEAVSAGTVATQEIPTLSQGSAYNGVGGRDWGNRYCDIDLAEQHVRFYDENGTLIWESDCISGTPDGEHDTSVGVFWLNQKQSPSMLIGYENGKKIYETQVTYWMPFDGNSIGLHDANWQPGFGGSMYAQGYGSHGCVNLPVGAAAELYSIIQPGDCVVSHW